VSYREQARGEQASNYHGKPEKRNTTMAKWIDHQDATVGDIGYLVETHTNGRTSWSLWDRPLRTNVSHEPRLSGWCGETDNRSRFARGVGRVVRVNAAGDRAQIVTLAGDELSEFLARDGYPELAA
jgi:hypothetical protein